MSAGQEVGPLDREGRSLIQPPLPPDEATRALAAAAGVSTVGLRPSFVTPAAAHSHPDCRAIFLILIVAPQQSGSSSSSSPASSASARDASNSRSPRLVPTPTNGAWPQPASSQPPDASPRRRKKRGNPTHHPPETPKRPTPSAQTAPGTRSSSPRPLRNHRRVAKDQAPPMRNAR